LVIPNIRNPFFADLARGVEDAAYQQNCAVLTCNYDEDAERESFYLDVMRAESVDGTIIPPINEKDPALRRAIELGMVVVCVDRSLSHLAVDKVEVDNWLGSFEAVSHLLARGHRSIGVIAGPTDSSTGRERLRGYRDALTRAGLVANSKLIRHGDYKEESGRILTHELLARARPPTAIFACNSLMAIGALATIKELRLEIPRQIALVGFDDLPLSALLHPPLTVVRQPAYEVGQAAADLLFRRLEDPSRPAASVMLSPTLIVRQSS